MQIKNYNHRNPISLFCFWLFVFSLKPLLLLLTAVRALSSHQCGVGSDPSVPAPSVGWGCCWFSLLLPEVFFQVLRFCPLLQIQFCFLEHKDTFERPLKNLKVLRAFRVYKFIIFLKEISIHKHHKIYSIATSINPWTYVQIHTPTVVYEK